MLAEDQRRPASSADRESLCVVTRCAHCMTIVDEDLILAPPNVQRLQDHLLGCPEALSACEPALPTFRSHDALLRQFIVERKAGTR